MEEQKKSPLRLKMEKEWAEEYGKEFLVKQKELLDEEWNYLLYMGFVKENE